MWGEGGGGGKEKKVWSGKRMKKSTTKGCRELEEKEVEDEKDGWKRGREFEENEEDEEMEGQ